MNSSRFSLNFLGNHSPFVDVHFLSPVVSAPTQNALYPSILHRLLTTVTIHQCVHSVLLELSYLAIDLLRGVLEGLHDVLIVFPILYTVHHYLNMLFKCSGSTFSHN